MIFDIIAVIITVAVILLVIFGVLIGFGSSDQGVNESVQAALKRGAWILTKTLLAIIALCVAFGGAGIILAHGLTTLHAWVF